MDWQWRPLESPLALSGSQTLVLVYVEEAQGHNDDSSFKEEAGVRKMTCGKTWCLGVLVYVDT